MSKTTHCSVTSPSTLVAFSQEAEGGLFPILSSNLSATTSESSASLTTSSMGCSGALGAGGLAQQARGMFSASENGMGDSGAGGGTGIGPGEEGGVSASSIGRTLMGGVWNSGEGLLA